MAVTLAERLGLGYAPDSPSRAVDARRVRPGGQTPGTLEAQRPPTTAPPIPMEKFVIEGGVPLSGTIVPAGNKNGALPILAACLLTDEEVVLRNVPRISDVETMTQLLQT